MLKVVEFYSLSGEFKSALIPLSIAIQTGFIQKNRDQKKITKNPKKTFINFYEIEKVGKIHIELREF